MNKFIKIRDFLQKRLLLGLQLGFVVFVLLFLHFIPQNLIFGSSTLVAKDVATTSGQEQADVGLKTILKIPAIDVDSKIIPVGITLDGTMGVPNDPSEVAWFNLGPNPGEIGSAVIAGHYGWQNNTPAVFDNLYKLNKGDQIFVENVNGVSDTFVVSEIRTYKVNESVSEVFISRDNKSHLNLITCTGVWNKDEKTYSERLVVFADKQ